MNPNTQVPTFFSIDSGYLKLLAKARLRKYFLQYAKGYFQIIGISYKVALAARVLNDFRVSAHDLTPGSIKQVPHIGSHRQQDGHTDHILHHAQGDAIRALEIQTTYRGVDGIGPPRIKTLLWRLQVR